MSQNAPVLDQAGDEVQPTSRDAARPRRRPPRRAQRRTWDLTAVGILTPALVVGLAVGILGLSQIVYPDPEPPATPVPTRAPIAIDAVRPPPTAVVAQPIDAARLNAGIVEKAPAFDWPEVDDLKVVPNPGRANEVADYVPNIASVETRRLISASTVTLVLHQSAPFAQGAVEEIAKAYPLRAGKVKVVDLSASAGYLPDDSAYGVALVFQNYRIHIETVLASPPVRPDQRSDVEYQTLHLADHILRRAQEVVTVSRTPPEATAVHWRDHLARRLPFGRS